MVSVVFIYLIREKGGVIEREERDNTGVSNHLLNSLVPTVNLKQPILMPLWFKTHLCSLRRGRGA